MECLLQAEGLCFSYGRADIVTDVGLALRRGEILGFVGPNGAGKTTTIKLLLGLLTPTRGAITAFGLSMRRDRLRILRRIGALVETPMLYPHLTAAENLRIQQRVHGVPRARIGAALEQTGLAGAAARRVRHFSLGMKQRLGIAMALLHGPELLVLDEPANGLDPDGIHELRLLLKRLAADDGVAVLISSHILSELEQVISNVAIIAGGRLRFAGPLADLRADHTGRLTVVVDRSQEAGEILRRHGHSPAELGAGALSLEIPGRAAGARINALLVAAGLEVYALSCEQPDLESMYLRIVNGRTEARPA